MSDSSEKIIIYFDGVCNLCNFFVNFLIKRDKNKIFRFASLQGNTAKKLGLSAEGVKASVVVQVADKLLYESDAALLAIQKIGGVWSVFAVFKIVPKFIRDGIYRIIANNRYKMFGRQDTCRLPTKEEKNFFLD